MRVLAALRRVVLAEVTARLHHALTMEKLYVEGEARGLSLDDLVRLEARALQSRGDDRFHLTVSSHMACAVAGFGGRGVSPPAASTLVEELGDANAATRHLGRLLLIDLFARLAPRSTTDLKESRHAR